MAITMTKLVNNASKARREAADRQVEFKATYCVFGMYLVEVTGPQSVVERLIGWWTAVER